MIIILKGCYDRMYVIYIERERDGFKLHLFKTIGFKQIQRLKKDPHCYKYFYYNLINYPHLLLSKPNKICNTNNIFMHDFTSL